MGQTTEAEASGSGHVKILVQALCPHCATKFWVSLGCRDQNENVHSLVCGSEACGCCFLVSVDLNPQVTAFLPVDDGRRPRRDTWEDAPGMRPDTRAWAGRVTCCDCGNILLRDEGDRCEPCAKKAREADSWPAPFCDPCREKVLTGEGELCDSCKGRWQQPAPKPADPLAEAFPNLAADLADITYTTTPPGDQLAADEADEGGAPPSRICPACRIIELRGTEAFCTGCAAARAAAAKARRKAKE